MKQLLFKFIRPLFITFSGKGLGRYPLISRVVKYVLATTKPSGIALITCQGFKIYVNTSDKGLAPDLLQKGYYDKEETELIRSIVSPGMIVLDVGANIGYFSLIAAKALNMSGYIYAFEPEPKTFELLTKNIETNGMQSLIQPVQKGLSARAGVLELFRDPINMGNHSYDSKNINNEFESIKTLVVTLDDFLSETRRKDIKIDLMKIDVQGAEGLVFEGATNTLNFSNKIKIVMEFWPFGLRNFGTDPIKLLSDFKKMGFKIHMIRHGKRKVEIMEIMEICESTKSGRGYVNLLLEK